MLWLCTPNISGCHKASVTNYAPVVRPPSLAKGPANYDSLRATKDGRRTLPHRFRIIGSRAAPYNPASLPSRARVMIVLRPFPGSTSAEAPWLAARGSGGAVAAYTIERHRSSSKIVGEKASHALEAPPPIT